MTEFFSGALKDYRDLENNVYKEIMDLLPENMVNEKAVDISEAVQKAVLGEGRLSQYEDVVIDGRVSEIGNNYNISVNASNLGDNAPDSIAIGIIKINKDNLSITSRYANDRKEIEIEQEPEKDTDSKFDEQDKYSYQEEEIEINADNNPDWIPYDEIVKNLNGNGMYIDMIEGSESAARIFKDGTMCGTLTGLYDEKGIAGGYISGIRDDNRVAIDSYDTLYKTMKDLIPEREPMVIAYDEVNEEEPAFEENGSIEVDTISNLEEESKSLIEMFTEEYSEGFGVQDPDGHTKILSAKQIPGYVEEHSISAESMEELEQKLAKALVNDLEESIKNEKTVKGQEIIDKFKEEVEEINNGSVIDEDISEKDENVFENKIEEEKKEDTMETEKITLNITEDMSEKEARAEAIRVLNGGKEPTQSQLDFINMKGERTSGELNDEIEDLKEQKENILNEIERNERKIESLTKSLGNHIEMALANGCEKDFTDRVTEDIQLMHKTNNSLDSNRATLAEIELSLAEARKERNVALSREAAQHVRGGFQKAQDTLKKGSDFVIGSLKSMRNAFEQVNEKVADMRDTHEKEAAYRHLSREIDSINKDYILNMAVVRAEYNRNMETLAKAIEKAERQTMMKGLVKDMFRVALHKEPIRDYEMSEKHKAAIAEIRDMIAENKREMIELNEKYEEAIPQLKSELSEIKQSLDERGVNIKDFFKDDKESRDTKADEMNKESKKAINSRDDDFER